VLKSANSGLPISQLGAGERRPEPSASICAKIAAASCRFASPTAATTGAGTACAATGPPQYCNTAAQQHSSLAMQRQGRGAPGPDLHLVGVEQVAVPPVGPAPRQVRVRRDPRRRSGLQPHRPARVVGVAERAARRRERVGRGQHARDERGAALGAAHVFGRNHEHVRERREDHADRVPRAAAARGPVRGLHRGGECAAPALWNLRRRDETCPVSTEGGTRRVRFVREGGGARGEAGVRGGGAA